MQVVVVVVVACWWCIPLQLAPMLVLTFATCAGIVFLSSTGANTPLAHVVMIAYCNLCWWCFSAFHLPLCNWHCVVGFVCGICMWCMVVVYTVHVVVMVVTMRWSCILYIPSSRYCWSDSMYITCHGSVFVPPTSADTLLAHIHMSIMTVRPAYCILH